MLSKVRSAWLSVYVKVKLYNFNSILEKLTASTTKGAPTPVIFIKIAVFTYHFKHLVDKVNVLGGVGLGFVLKKAYLVL